MQKADFTKRLPAKPVSTVSYRDDDSVIELVYDPKEEKTSLCVWADGKTSVKQSYKLKNGKTLVPYKASNNLIKNQIILFAKEPTEYSIEEKLIADIQEFIHRYVDVSESFEKIASYYVLFSWIYDNFNELPYLRLRGDYGCGKTRFLLTVGSLCYKPVFASGASTISPIFHILDTFQGTLLIDEGDFRFSDEKADLTKILNNGNVRGIPVLRCEVNKNKEFNPRAFRVFSPKIVATRGGFDDPALESRFITEKMRNEKLRSDIPLSLNDEYKNQALKLRNKLLMFRFNYLGRMNVPEVPKVLDRSLEPRINQIFAPLLSIIKSKKVKDDLLMVAKSYSQHIQEEKESSTEYRLQQIVTELSNSQKRTPVKAITERFIADFGDDYDFLITPKWIGAKLRNDLGLKTQKSNGVFVLAD